MEHVRPATLLKAALGTNDSELILFNFPQVAKLYSLPAYLYKIAKYFLTRRLTLETKARTFQIHRIA